MLLSVNALETISLTVFILAFQTDTANTVFSCLLNFDEYRFANPPVSTLATPKTPPTAAK